MKFHVHGVRRPSVLASCLSIAILAGGCEHADFTLTSGATNVASILATDVESEFDRQLNAILSGQEDRLVLEDEPLSRQHLRRIPADSQLRVLEAVVCFLELDGYVELSRLEALEHLALRQAEMDDECFRAIAACQGLRLLNLPRTTVTNESLRVAANIANLELLRLGSPHITDAGLRELSPAGSLKFLHLIGAPITDQGLEYVEAMANLESFYIDDSRVSEQGVARLARNRPDLHIHVDQRHPERLD